ncbi:phosphotransferase [Glycomyces sp. NPDC048151]|uniref:phosphotransferase n=1 Tax=Glycomyces sp. NPDC048151 TaxID=3364002 RepID=UPI00371DE6DE
MSAPGSAMPADPGPDLSTDPNPPDTAAARPPQLATPHPITTGSAAAPAAPPDFAATAIRPAYETLPDAVRARIAAELGGEPAAISIAGGGFTTGFAGRVRSAGGELFIKAAGPLTPEVRDAYRDEARVTAALPPEIPAAKVRFHADIDDWTVTGFQALHGKPMTLPLHPDDLDRMLDAWALTADALNPPPPALVASGIRPKTAENLSVFQKIANGDTPPVPLPPKLQGRTADLAAIETGIERIFVTDQVTHGDLRPDNFFLGHDRAWICDWTKPRYTPPWVDTVNVLIIANGDGHDADRLFWQHSTAEGVTADELDTALAAITGALLDGWDEAPARIVSPAIHGHMRWAAGAAADWLAQRRGW